MHQPAQQQPGGGVARARLAIADVLSAPALPAPPHGWNALKDWLRHLERLAREIDWAPDLGQNIGSLAWFRGLATLSLLCLMAWLLWPGFRPISATAPSYGEETSEELRSQMIMPMAYGGDTGRAMGPTDAVVALRESPERPSLELIATVGRGDSFTRVLQRAGVGGGDAKAVVDMVSGVLPVSDIRDGTRLDILLGRRPGRNQARPLDQLAFRARFDLNVEIVRTDGRLTLIRKPIRVDTTPLRIRGTVGGSLYRSARSAGAPAAAIQSYLRAIGQRLSLGRDVRADDEFDIIIDYKRAETGEVEMGDLLYAGLERSGKPKVQMVRWQVPGAGAQWFEASGVGEERGEFARPVSGAMTSGYGIRRHPILGYRRMHSGLDFKASHGQPIYATADGVVTYAGRNGGYGNYVRLAHGGGLGSGYGHMSRIAVRNGARVRRGQVIGYAGSTGLSTGPHLHYELYRGGKAIDPRSVRYTSRAQLSGRDLANFKVRLSQLMKVEPGAALQSIAPPPEAAEPQREIEKIGGTAI